MLVGSGHAYQEMTGFLDRKTGQGFVDETAFGTVVGLGHVFWKETAILGI